MCMSWYLLIFFLVDSHGVWGCHLLASVTCFKYVAPNGKDVGSLKFLEKLCHWFIPNPSIL
jgi:hypothetical protein